MRHDEFVDLVRKMRAAQTDYAQLPKNSTDETQKKIREKMRELVSILQRQVDDAISRNSFNKLF